MKATFYLCSLILGSSLLHAQTEWRNWRGPNGNGALENGTPPMEFSSEGQGVAWKTSLPGRGCSTPVVSNGLIFVTAPIGDKDSLLAFDLTGKKKWEQSFGTQIPGRGQRVGSGANSSAVTDGETVVAYFKSGVVAACSQDGKKLWETNLQEKYGEDKLWWDQGTSPLLAEGMVVVAVMQTDGNSYLAALDAKTGKELWKTDRTFETGDESGDSYTTPHLAEIDGVNTIISFGADHITGHDLKTGKQLWFAGGINPDSEKNWRTIASSVVSDGIVIVPHGRGEFLLALKAGGEGDVTKSNLLWRKKMTNTDAATPVARDGLIYLLVDRGRERGTVLCLDAKTGDELWKGELPKSASTYYASPILVGDTLCCPREDGVVIMAKVSKDGLGKVTENNLGEALIASPIYVDGMLILRGNKNLWALK